MEALGIQTVQQKIVTKKSKLCSLHGIDNEEIKRENALFGRTCPMPVEIIPYRKEDPNDGMTPELQAKLWLLDKALEDINDEELGHYLVEKMLGSPDEPESIKIIEEFEAKYIY
jgi:hypothetical protein